MFFVNVSQQKTADDWKYYEEQKFQVLENLSKAEMELEKEPVGGGHDLAQKDLEVKKVRII